MKNSDDYKDALEDIHDLIEVWATQGLDTSECVYAGLHTFLSAAFELAPNKREAHNMMAAAFAESCRRAADNTTTKENTNGKDKV